jgi:hypothetical protein
MESRFCFLVVVILARIAERWTIVPVKLAWAQEPAAEANCPGNARRYNRSTRRAHRGSPND